MLFLCSRSGSESLLPSSLSDPSVGAGCVGCGGEGCGCVLGAFDVELVDFMRMRRSLVLLLLEES